MEAVARLGVALIFIAIFIQLIKRGPQGVSEWYRAKFLGQPTIHGRKVKVR